MNVSEKWLRMSGSYPFSVCRVAHGVADLKHYNAEYTESGDGPPLILIPGLAGGIDLVDPLARELAQTYRVICYQLRGETDSFALRRRFGLKDLTEDLSEFIEWHGLEQPTVLGVSFGGVIALHYAARHPRRLKALALQGVGMRFEAGLVQRVASLVLTSYPLPADSPFVNQFFNLLFGCKPTAEQAERTIRTCWQTDQAVMAHRLRLLRRLTLEPILDRVATPTQIISGAKDVLVSRQNSRDLAERLPDCRHLVLPQVGHLAPVSHTAAVAEAVRRLTPAEALS